MKTSLLALAATTSSLLALGAPAHADFTRSTSKTQCFPTNDCDNAFSAGYTGNAQFSYVEGALGLNPRLSADAELRGWVQLFGVRQDVAILRGHGQSQRKGTRGYDVEVLTRDNTAPYLFRTTFAGHWNGEFEASHTIPAPVLSQTDQVMVGPVPVTVTARVSANARFSVKGTVDLDGIDVQFTPRITANASADASTGMEFASVGAYGQLDLLNVRLPTASAGHATPRGACRGIDWELGVDLTVGALSGELGLIARLFGAEFRQALVSWPGFSAEFDLLDASGRYCI